MKPLCDPVLESVGVVHGFGQRGSQVPDATCFPQQVHGIEVVRSANWSPAAAPQADAIVSAAGQPIVGIVTADCVPILVAARDKSVVAAIHAGWRGLAAGVIEAGLDAFRAILGSEDWVAAVGPAARGCCYEVDEPVRDALSRRYAHWLDSETLTPAREGHFLLDLPRLATRVVSEIVGNSAQIGVAHRSCTICDPSRFESHRRDGSLASRLRHFVCAEASGASDLPIRVDSPVCPP